MKGIFQYKKDLNQREKTVRKVLFVAGAMGLIFAVLFAWKEWTEQFARWTPSYAFTQLPEFDTVSQLSHEQLDIIYEQTGLTQVGLQRLEKAGRLDQLEVFHRAFFLEAVETSMKELHGFSYPLTSLPMTCFQNSPISWEEYVMDLEGNRGAYLPMVPLENGDILLTPNSHSFGWRQGHSALVVDGEEGITLESVVLGQNSTTQWAWKWQGFPAVIILRPVDTTLGECATELALDYLFDIPYILTIGVLSEKFRTISDIKGTNCSHLVWQAYQWAGVDIDSNGGVQVLPEDMAWSEHLEVVQIWGVDPAVLWAK